jgi:glycosyltransferase involved in cell wall biosynthesis
MQGSWRHKSGLQLKSILSGDLLQAAKMLFKREKSDFPNLERFAKKNRSFRKSVRTVFPACKPKDVGKTLLGNIDEFVARLDYAALTSMLEAFRAYLDPNVSPKAREFWDALILDCIQITKSRLNSGQMNSLWGVTPIVNLSAGVAADRALNVSAKSLVFTTYHISSNFDVVLSEIQNRLVAERGQDWVLFRWMILIWAIANYDFFHLYNDRGLIEPAGGYGSPRFGISLREMEIYRAADKRLYTYAYGADHRLRQKTLGLGEWSFCSECPEPGTFCVCDDVGGGEMLRVIREHSTAVIAHGLAMKIIPGARNIPYIAVDASKLRSKLPRRVNPDQFVIGHFPNHGYFKGSKYLEAAIRKLQAEGHNIEFLQLSGKPNEEIREAMSEIDVLVDQLVSGSFGLTAIEAMALGCPVICYLHDGVAIAEPDACPVIPANPETIADVLRALVLDPKKLSRARIAGPIYVKRNYSIQSLGKHLADLYVETADLPESMKAMIAKNASKLNL